MKKVKTMRVEIDILDDSPSRCGIACKFQSCAHYGMSFVARCGFFNEHLGRNERNPKRCQKCINIFGA